METAYKLKKHGWKKETDWQWTLLALEVKTWKLVYRPERLIELPVVQTLNAPCSDTLINLLLPQGEFVIRKYQDKKLIRFIKPGFILNVLNADLANALGHIWILTNARNKKN